MFAVHTHSERHERCCGERSIMGFKKSFRELPLKLPIKLGPASNGEYNPVPSSAALRWVERTAMERSACAAARTGLSRREFLRSSAGAATVLLTLNEVTGCAGGHYAVPPEAAYDAAAADTALAGDEFIFDVQTHHVSLDRKWWDDARPTMADFLVETPQAKCGSEPYLECFGQEPYLKEVFLDSDTSLAVLSALWGTPEMNPILPEEAVRTREYLEKMDGARRLLIHGVVWGKAQSDGQRAEWMRQLVEEQRISAFKLYPVWSPDGQGYRMDDPRFGLKILEQGLRAGLPLFAIHKGLQVAGAPDAFVSSEDIGPAARAFPGATLLIYHSGYQSEHREGPYDPQGKTGINTLIASLEANGVGKLGNVYAELGSVWREVMRDPEQAAHVIGKLLRHLGEDRILWGTDALWYGSPQDQIQAFRSFQISQEFQERFGYPPLTPEAKRKIFGLNAARLYGIDVEDLRRAQRSDAVARARQAYRHAPNPTHSIYGPETASELGRLVRWEGARGSR